MSYSPTLIGTVDALTAASLNNDNDTAATASAAIGNADFADNAQIGVGKLANGYIQAPMLFGCMTLWFAPWAIEYSVYFTYDDDTIMDGQTVRGNIMLPGV